MSHSPTPDNKGKQSNTRLCRRCGTPFIPTKAQIKRYDYACLECRKFYGKQWRDKRRSKGLSISGKMMSLDWYRKYWAKYNKEPNVRKRKASKIREYRNDPQKRYKYLAREKTTRLKKQGLLVQLPCQICGDNKSEKHHPDYTKPEYVIWLCKKHHIETHKKLKTEGGQK